MFRYRRGPLVMATWMRLHIGSSYAAFLAVLLHSHARSGSPITIVLMLLTWIVIVSGVVGHYGQKLIYRLLPLVVEREFGLERLGPECEALRQRAEETVAAYPAIAREDVRDWPGLSHRLRDEDSPMRATIMARLPSRIQTMIKGLPPNGPDEQQKSEMLTAINAILGREDLFASASDNARSHDGDRERPGAVSLSIKVDNHRRLIEFAGDRIANRADRTAAAERFFHAVLTTRLPPQPGSVRGLLSGRSSVATSRNHFLRLKSMAGPVQGDILLALWDSIQQRQQMEIEFWSHWLGRLWMLVHGPAAWLLLLFTILHIWGSIRYGGF
jgi:hypothetical protein